MKLQLTKAGGAYQLTMPKPTLNFTKVHGILMLSLLSFVGAFMLLGVQDTENVQALTTAEVSSLSVNTSKPTSVSEYRAKREEIKEESRVTATEVSTAVSTLEGVPYRLLDAPSGYVRQANAKSVMGAHCLGSSTKNWLMMQGPDGSIADADHGCLQMVDGRYCVAVGSYFCYKEGTTPVGQYLDVILEDGTVIPCISGDWKADIHTNQNAIPSIGAAAHSHHAVDNSVVEFIAGSNKETGYDGWKAKLNTTSWWSVNEIVPEWSSPVAQIKVYDKVYELPS